MSNHNICFHREIRKTCGYLWIPRPVYNYDGNLLVNTSY